MRDPERLLQTLEHPLAILVWVLTKSHVSVNERPQTTDRGETHRLGTLAVLLVFTPLWSRTLCFALTFALRRMYRRRLMRLLQ